MIIKKYIGKTEEEVVAQAKAELGDNVVIMNVKNAPKKGLFGFMKKAQVEVTVAKEEENERYPSPTAGKSQEEVSLRETFRQVAKIAGTESPAAKSFNSERTEGARKGAGTDDTASGKDQDLRTDSIYAASEVSGREKDLLVEKLDSLQNMIEKTLQSTGDSPEKEEQNNEEENSELVKFMKLLYNTMLDNEVDEKYANQIIEEMEKNAKPNMPFDYALSDVYQKMVLKFGKPSPIEKEGKKPHVVFFVGPTGVGKTTTIAKIASRFRVVYNRKVALLTADTYRIAAAEQLRTYANILDVPFRVIYSVEEMEMALRDFRGYDFILVDTAGHSHHNAQQRENMDAFIRSVGDDVEKEVHLVLSATTKYRDLLSIADAYSGITDYKIIFTKLDETQTLGNLLNLKLYTGASLSYVTNGQNVPDDIEIFNPQQAVKQLLGGKSK